MKILFVGDIVGKAGMRLACELLPGLIGREQIDLTVVNAENAEGGKGISPGVVERLFESGADVLTGGNHSWSRREGIPVLESDPRVLRPHNYPSSPGTGLWTGETPAGVRCAVLNLQGRIFLPPIECPFRAVEDLLRELEDRPVRILDFHAEATSEKVAMGWHLDGRVTAVLGTHTHVPTADARVLPGGTAYCTDVGMTGAWDSVIGMDREAALERLRSQRPIPMRAASGDPRLCCAIVTCEAATGRATAVEHRILSA